MKKAIAAVCLAAAAASPAWAANIAIFGDNDIFDFLNDGSNTVSLVTMAQLETAGFLNPFDVFVYTRDGITLGATLTAVAAQNVRSFVVGNVVLFTSDLADNGFPGDESNALLTNAVAFAGNKGFIGELTGACAAMTSNSLGFEALDLIDGSCTQIARGPGGDPMVVVQPTSPIVDGLPASFSLGAAHETFALLSGVDPNLIVATNTANQTGGPIPSIVARQAPITGISEPGVLALLGFGLLAAAGFGRKREAPSS